jgi:hypothetical protein
MSPAAIPYDTTQASTIQHESEAPACYISLQSRAHYVSKATAPIPINPIYIPCHHCSSRDPSSSHQATPIYVPRRAIANLVRTIYKSVPRSSMPIQHSLRSIPTRQCPAHYDLPPIPHPRPCIARQETYLYASGLCSRQIKPLPALLVPRLPTGHARSSLCYPTLSTGQPLPACPHPHLPTYQACPDQATAIYKSDQSRSNHLSTAYK